MRNGGRDWVAGILRVKFNNALIGGIRPEAVSRIYKIKYIILVPVAGKLMPNWQASKQNKDYMDHLWYE